jgi:small-conductance mechanosensitive channel
VVILHAFLALLAGLATIVLLVLVTASLLKRIAPDWSGEPRNPRVSYIFVNLGYSFLAAAAGGYVSAWKAVSNSLVYILALSIIVLVLAALSALQSHGKQPIAYQLALVAVSPLGVVAGGLVRLRVEGIL